MPSKQVPIATPYLCPLPSPDASGAAVGVALIDPDEPPAAPVGDVAELGHVDVDQVPGALAFVVLGRLASDPVHAGRPVESGLRVLAVSGQDRSSIPTGPSAR
ncbi:hypothetical protein NLS1_31610 [Nocardioides sp. LS1]|nr:hypothetical protein NLS1_31610 [Nocardioides sp. LS1]